MTSRVWVRLVPLSVALVGLSGCSTGEEAEKTDEGGEVLRAGDVAVLVDHDEDGFLDALLEGRLAVVDGCLGVEQSKAPETAYVVVWPDGTEILDEEPLTVALDDGSQFSIGDKVDLGGAQGGFVNHEDNALTAETCPGAVSWRAN